MTKRPLEYYALKGGKEYPIVVPEEIRGKVLAILVERGYDLATESQAYNHGVGDSA